MDLISPNENILSDDVINDKSTFSLNLVEGVASQNYQRFLISAGVMGLLSKLLFKDDTNLTIQKSIYMGLATLASDLLLGVAIKMNYLPNDMSSNYQTGLAQVALETFLYFPIASQGKEFMPNFQGKAFRQALISSAGSQVVQMGLTNKSSQ